MDRQKCFALLLLLLPWPFADIPIQAAAKNEPAHNISRAEKIKSNKSYYYGNGFGSTIEEAKRAALEDLCGKISRTVSIDSKSRDTHDSETFDTRTYISSFVTLSNTESIVVYNNDEKAEVLVYVEKAQVESDMAARVERIKTLVAQGCDMEKRLEIAGALRYLNWAYVLAKSNNGPVMLDIDGMNYDAKSWLHSKISVILNTLKFNLDNVEEREGELDPYLVNLNVMYLDQPVADLDYSYMNNGNRVYNQHVKNGRASLAFERLPSENIEISVAYRYNDEAQGYDAELTTVLSTAGKYTFPQADINVPCKGSAPDKFKIKERKQSKEERQQAEVDAATAPATVGKPRSRVATQSAAPALNGVLITSMEKIKDAIDCKKYSTVSDLFTTDGYALFLRMMQSGTVKTAKSSPVWSTELAGDFIVGRSIPVTIKYKGGHTVTEEIVFRFNADNKVESVAYALTKRAEDDIFRQNSWPLGARYAILHFMEDYQTAYALKRIDYIESIFSDDAVIIHGKRNNKTHVKGDNGYFFTDDFTYTKSTKEEFISHLRESFPQKNYIKLTFEDNEIRQQAGELFNNIYWIEIRQFYSSSNYNDLGYLTLMIDMRTSNPVIKVRTWAPKKIGLETLMTRFNIE